MTAELDNLDSLHRLGHNSGLGLNTLVLLHADPAHIERKDPQVEEEDPQSVDAFPRSVYEVRGLSWVATTRATSREYRTRPHLTHKFTDCG